MEEKGRRRRGRRIKRKRRRGEENETEKGKGEVKGRKEKDSYIAERRERKERIKRDTNLDAERHSLKLPVIVFNSWPNMIPCIQLHSDPCTLK